MISFLNRLLLSQWRLLSYQTKILRLKALCHQCPQWRNKRLWKRKHLVLINLKNKLDIFWTINLNYNFIKRASTFILFMCKTNDWMGIALAVVVIFNIDSSLKHRQYCYYCTGTSVATTFAYSIGMQKQMNKINFSMVRKNFNLIYTF